MPKLRNGTPRLLCGTPWKNLPDRDPKCQWYFTEWEPIKSFVHTIFLKPCFLTDALLYKVFLFFVSHSVISRKKNTIWASCQFACFFTSLFSSLLSLPSMFSRIFFSLSSRFRYTYFNSLSDPSEWPVISIITPQIIGIERVGSDSGREGCWGCSIFFLEVVGKYRYNRKIRL